MEDEKEEEKDIPLLNLETSKLNTIQFALNNSIITKVCEESLNTRTGFNTTLSGFNKTQISGFNTTYIQGSIQPLYQGSIQHIY